uniref:PH domain-containing protein n=1 Tax=Caenorhabditis tropicalis TaxID=1561998 RepID=A0A1I7T020_9PELO
KMDYSEERIRQLPHAELLSHFLQMRDEYTEFQTSSSEIEKMMDVELDDLKRQLTRVEQRNHQMTQDQMRTKERHDEARIQWCQVEEQLRAENQELRMRNGQQQERIRKLEHRTDVLETSERNKEFLAMDLGVKLDQAIEKIAMLESELYERQVAAEEMHRQREEQMRTTTHSERPRLIVEPLRNEREEEQEEEEETSPGPSKDGFRMSIDDVHMEDVQHHDHHHDDVQMQETISKIDKVQIDENKKKTGTGSNLNQIVKDLIAKVEHLDSIFSSIRTRTTGGNSGNSSQQQTNNKNNNNTLTMTRA